MNGILKFILTIIGGILIGFGLGIFVYKNALLGKGQYEIAMILSLILGGFFIALGMPGKRMMRIEKEEQQTQA
jgi:NhaP-type Na+/H+ or K+/H+ antiporter